MSSRGASVTSTTGGDKLVIFDDTPAEVCSQCGETYFSPEVLEMMDKATLDGTPPDRELAVPVFSLP